MQSSLGRLEWGGTALSGNFTRISERILPFRLLHFAVSTDTEHLSLKFTSGMHLTWHWDHLSFDEMWRRMHIPHYENTMARFDPCTFIAHSLLNLTLNWLTHKHTQTQTHRHTHTHRPLPLQRMDSRRHSSSNFTDALCQTSSHSHPC